MRNRHGKGNKGGMEKKKGKADVKTDVEDK